MNRLGKTFMFLGALALAYVGTASGAQWEAGVDHNADRCYEQTVKLANGADPGSLSMTHCTRALRAEPLGRKDRSAILFNRGIIQRAQGDLVAAQASFEESVRLSRTVDQRNLALAEVARELGDYAVATEQYDLLANSAFVLDSEEIRVAVLSRREQIEGVETHFAAVQKGQACEGCHGADGISVYAEYPTLAGRQQDYLEEALRQFKSGERDNTVMGYQATLIDDADILVLAGYFASLEGPQTTRFE